MAEKSKSTSKSLKKLSSRRSASLFQDASSASRLSARMNARLSDSLRCRARTTGIFTRPSCLAAATRAWPLNNWLHSSMMTGTRKPNFSMLRRSLTSCFRSCSRALCGFSLMPLSGKISNEPMPQVETEGLLIASIGASALGGIICKLPKGRGYSTDNRAVGRRRFICPRARKFSVSNRWAIPAISARIPIMLLHQRRHAIASAKAERIRPYAAAQVLWESAGDARPTLLRDYWL